MFVLCCAPPTLLLGIYSVKEDEGEPHVAGQSALTYCDLIYSPVGNPAALIFPCPP
jgi:hypothetical protein